MTLYLYMLLIIKPQIYFTHKLENNLHIKK
jgi:hypothetical protein